jgi:hypothetical protein
MNLYMNIGISNWNNWSFDPTKMMFLTLFQFLSRLLNSNHPKHFSTYLVGRNGAMWNTCFSAPQNAKKENLLKHKNQYMSRCPTINFQLSIMSKWLFKHIRTKVSFKITIRKRHFYIDIRWPWIWNQYFYLGIWNDDRSFAFISAPYTIKFTEHKGRWFY